MSKKICPRCGSRKTAQILWGMPAFTEELEVKLKKYRNRSWWLLHHRSEQMIQLQMKEK